MYEAIAATAATPRPGAAAARAAKQTREDAGAWRQLRQELRQAAQAHAFTLVYQPRVCLGDGKLCGMEAQLRWPRRRGAMSPASAFMPLLAEWGLAQEVADWSLTEACRQATAWDKTPLCLVVPGAALQDGSLLAQVGTALTESGLAPDRLEIAITETALTGDNMEVLLGIAVLLDLGVSVALDGFGSASANLMTLKRLPLTVLKLDRSLVRDVPLDREASAVVLAAIDFAHALDITVVGCGVETAEQRAFLRRAGCDQAQGGICGKVVTREAVSAL